ncbi:hypothetical protein DPX16_14416 [Anabarilius grahami]|uniref:Ig-like domain-containing protein n=1 Tax=Anabarilius grahami TaxID=495550 RepID=A0A3N0XS09_ANAGA|nr:hypothetical protein DPX16_14416 [Anabarilius grahami]
MHCYQNDTDYDYKYWYRQIKGEGPVLIGSIVGTSETVEKDFETTFKVSGNARCVNVQQNLTPILANKNNKAEMKCSHDDSSMLYMYWYQQKDTAMVLIALSYGSSADFSDSVLITQWPKYLSSLPGSSVEMHCYQNDTNYDYKYWYRQIKGEEPVLIGSYIVSSDSYEKGFETGFKVSGNARCVNVQQNLTPILANKNNKTEIKCSYDDSGKPVMLWYQQKDTAMVLIVFSYGHEGDPTYEDGFKERFELKRTDTLNGVLEISSLSLSDSAVYYCAVTDFSDSVLITQWPKYISSLPGSSVEMHCYQNDTDYDYKFWYRQINGEGPVLIGSYIVNTPSYEKGFESGFTMSADFSDSVLITQWPKYISSLPGSSVEMHCYQNNTDYDYKFWYRQIKGEEPVLIGSYNFNTPSSEKDFESGFTMSADFCDSILITQWPKYISSLPGSSVEMHCYQNNTDYNYKYWYRQINGEGPVLIGSYNFNSPSSEKDFESGFTMSGQTSAQVVLQSTRFMTAVPGAEVTLDCSMAAGVSMSSYTMLWVFVIVEIRICLISAPASVTEERTFKPLDFHQRDGDFHLLPGSSFSHASRFHDSRRSYHRAPTGWSFAGEVCGGVR